MFSHTAKVNVFAKADPPSDITISANAVVYLIGGFNIRK